MKINVSVDLDWIEEDGSLDDEVKHELISGIKSAISHDCLAKVEKEASTQINKAIQAAIDGAKAKIEEKAVAFADDWLENEVEITDKWGDPTERTTVKDLIKKTFDGLMTKAVDAQGKFTDGYHSKSTLLQWLTGKRVQDVVEEKMVGLGKDIDNQITEAVNAGIRKNVSDKFAEMVVATAKHQNSTARITQQ